MIVYWIENNDGEKYGNARYFTATGVPKLYGTRKKAQQLIDEAINVQHHQCPVPNPLYGLARGNVIKGELR